MSPTLGFGRQEAHPADGRMSRFHHERSRRHRECRSASILRLPHAKPHVHRHRRGGHVAEQDQRAGHRRDRGTGGRRGLHPRRRPPDRRRRCSTRASGSRPSSSPPATRTSTSEPRSSPTPSPRQSFLAPADVIEHIEHSYEGKLKAWAHLGANLPTRLVDIAPLTATVAHRRRHHDRGTPRQRPARRPGVVPVRAGIALAVRRGAAVRGTPRVDRRQRHPGAAGRVDPRARRARGARRRRTSSPGHRIAGAPTDLTAITHTRDYLELFEKTVAASADAAEAEARSWRPTRTPG